MRAILRIEHSLRWHYPDRFNGFDLSPCNTGTPVTISDLQQTLTDCQESGDPGKTHSIRHGQKPTRWAAALARHAGWIGPFAKPATYHISTIRTLASSGCTR